MSFAASMRVAALAFWLLAAVALLFAYADSARLTFSPRHACYLRKRTKARAVLGLLEASLAAAAITLEITQRSMARIPGVPSRPWLLPLSGATVSALGALFAVLAKRALGRHFTVNLAIKESHRLVTSGPYAVVRHPIYLGLLLFVAGTALVFSSLYLAGLAISLAFCFAIQFRLEDPILAAHFGAEYEAYRARVPALLPRLRRPASR